MILKMQKHKLLEGVSFSTPFKSLNFQYLFTENLDENLSNTLPITTGIRLGCTSRAIELPTLIGSVLRLFP